VTEGRADERTDEQLMAAVADRDLGALRELHARHEPWLRARLRGRCGDPDVVAEAIQDTFLAVWRGAHRYEGRGQVAAWIWGIGIRRLVGRLRTRPAPVPLASAAIERALGRSRGTGVDAGTPSAEESVLVGIEHGALDGALRSLSPELRAVVQATVLDGLTTREAARLLGIPSGTVKTRMRRARIELRGAIVWPTPA